MTEYALWLLRSLQDKFVRSPRMQGSLGDYSWTGTPF
jgi:hypothetical protein